MDMQEREYYLRQDDFEKYYALYQEAREIEKTDAEKALLIYLNIIKEYKPDGSVYYERPAIIFEKLKLYDECIRFCESAIAIGHVISEDFLKRIERCKQKKAGTYRKGLPVQHSTVSDNLDATISIWNKGVNEIDVKFPDWYISVSFGISSSPSFTIAATLASHAPIFIKSGTEKQPIFQSVYSDDPQEYLAFIKLYELVADWKTTFVVINGKIIDRKIIGKLNYCYGDRCRSGNPSFCSGASEMSENPFGCHRLQMNASNHPWYSFGKSSPHIKQLWLIDKPAIMERAESFAQVYSLCPVFNWDKIREDIDDLPDTIDLNKHKEYELTDEGLIKPYVIRVVYGGISKGEEDASAAQEDDIPSICEQNTEDISIKNPEYYEAETDNTKFSIKNLDKILSQYRSEFKFGAIVLLIISVILFAIAGSPEGEEVLAIPAVIASILLTLAIIVFVKIKKFKK